MQEKKIPIPYKVILKRFWRCSEFGRLRTGKARVILIQIFRMEKMNASRILKEMNEEGFVKLNCQYIELNIPFEEIIIE